MTGHAGLILTGELDPSLILLFCCFSLKVLENERNVLLLSSKNWGHPNHLLSSITPMKNVCNFFHREGKKPAINMAENL